MSRPVWRSLAEADLDALCKIAAAVHPGLPERREVFEEKLRLFPAGCFALAWDGALTGYAIAHPWRLGDVPPLDSFLEKIPVAADCLYLHDVAVTPAARGYGAAAVIVERLCDVARRRGFVGVALTSVYGSDRLWRRHGFEAGTDPAIAPRIESYGAGALYMIRRV